jgi:Xaa-Pro aminopeptidase
MSTHDYSTRVERLQAEMSRTDTDVVLLSVGSDLPYFTGYEAMPSERLTMLAVPSNGRPSLFLPTLEAPRVPEGAFDVVPWDEPEDPVSLVVEAVGEPRKAAIGDHTWAAFLVDIQVQLTNTKWTKSSPITSKLRVIKDAKEISLLRAAAEAVDRVLARVPQEVEFAGRTEAEVSRQLGVMTVEEGHDEATFGIVASGPNGASPHHEPGTRVIQVGDLVVCDFGGRLGGYCSDVTRTFSVGEPSEKQIEVHAAVMAANQAGRDAVAPGVPCQEVDRAARRVIDEAGYGEFFIHRTGHGIGLEVHEHPYMVEGNATVLEEGNAFSVEPGIYLPGEFGVRIEDIVACGLVAVDDLNRADRSLRTVS